MIISILSVIYVVFFCVVLSAQFSPFVQIKAGLIIGESINFLGYDVNQYLGVPYAQPPVGPLRFKKPLALSSYPQITFALTNPPACPQYSKNPFPWYINSTDKSENCLYLNIWTPADASPTNKKAVMYWIYGGGYRYGSIRDKLYSGIPLVSLGDIIVVTVNYRLGAFGFLSSGSSDAPGNVGIDAVTLSRADFFLSPNVSVDDFLQWNDDLLRNNPRTSIINGDFECTELLTGYNKNDGSFLVTAPNPELYGFFGEKNPYINKSLGEDTIRKLASLYPNSESIVDHYFSAYLIEDTKFEIRHQVDTAIGDMLFHCPIMYYAEKCAEQNQNVYFYVFTHRPSVTPWAEWMGIAHFEEVQFVFGQPLLNPEKYLPSEVDLSRQMIEIWTSFVKYGKPNVSWPLFSREIPTFKYLGPESGERMNDEGGPGSNCDFLRPFYGL